MKIYDPNDPFHTQIGGPCPFPQHHRRGFEKPERRVQAMASDHHANESNGAVQRHLEAGLKTTELLRAEPSVALTASLGSLVRNGLTAHGSLIEIAKRKAADVLFRSGATGVDGVL